MEFTIEEACQEALDYYKKISKKNTVAYTKSWFKRTGEEAGNRKNKLQEAKTAALERISNIANSSIAKDKTYFINKHFKEQKEYSLMLVELNKSYIFIQKIRKDVTGESLEYLLNLHLNEKGKNFSKIQKVTLKQLIPSFGVVFNKEKSFALTINNINQLKKLASKRSNISLDISNKILELSQTILKEKMQNRTKDDGWIYGPGGIAFESAVRKLANSISEKKDNINDIDASWRDFEKDIQVFYKAGDLSRDQVERLFDLKNTVMELKRISLKENSVGAGVAKDKTIESALDQIKNICNNPDRHMAEDEFKKMFSDSDSENMKRRYLSEVEKETIKTIEDNIKINRT